MKQVNEADTSSVEIDVHRWYAVVSQGDKVLGVIGNQGPREGLGLYESVDEWEEMTL